MPKYFCDYCDAFLTHDSPSVRKTHCGGRKHRENVKFYYQRWMESQAQNLVDATTKAFKEGKLNGMCIPPPTMRNPKIMLPPRMNTPRIGPPVMHPIPPGAFPMMRPIRVRMPINPIGFRPGMVAGPPGAPVTRPMILPIGPPGLRPICSLPIPRPNAMGMGPPRGIKSQPHANGGSVRMKHSNHSLGTMAK